MSLLQNRTGFFILVALTCLWVVLGFSASDGLYNTDETLYRLGAETFRSTGTFVVQNGYESFRSEDLRHLLLVNGPSGLVPQYPVGSALAATPLIDVFGYKSLLALNVLAGIGALFSTYFLALRLFGSDDVANLTVVVLALCTFWSEYVVGLWPHSVSLFLVTLAIVFFLAALDRTRAAWHPAFWAGICVGVGMSFRLEVLLLLPAIAAATILYARKPIEIMIAGALGMAPIIALLSYANKVKFDTYSPLSYGQSGGGTDASTYWPLGLAMLFGLTGLIFLRNRSAANVERKYILAGTAVFVLGVVILNPFVPILQKLTGGIHALLLDSTSIQDSRPKALMTLPDGTVAFWGLPKKALFQSLPWLGCLALLIGLVWGERRRSVAIALLFVTVWALPFILRSWHGGMSSNMRYLLPVIPLLAMLSIWGILELAQRRGSVNPYIFGIASLVGFAVPLVWILFVKESTFWINQVASLYLFCAIAVLSFVAGFVRHKVLAQVSLYAVAAGLGWSSYLAFQDYSLSQSRRTDTAAIAEAISSISDRAVLYGAPAHFYPAFSNPNQLLARPPNPATQVDATFVKAACGAGYRVLFADYLIEQLGDLAGSVSEYMWKEGIKGPGMVEFNCGT
ncbi:hypothetical protein [Roseovarius rhodophyticola]|uniref:Glycosyltransferase RgtA/B/C/D-like domain-containing protein n=1 Tax=Roseovarius rhodophyticola TaxID=3080827 RepID=A0ABZ2TFV6_9RHOB